MAGINGHQDSFSKASTEYTVDYTALARATYKHEADINVGAEEDNTNMNNCHITGIQRLSSDKLFLVDNLYCKIVDVTKSRVITERKVGYDNQCWDAAILPDNTVAVTCTNGKTLRFMSTQNDELVNLYSVSTRSPCYGIAYRNGKLAVSFVESNHSSRFMFKAPTTDDEFPSRVEIRNIPGTPNLFSSFTDNNPGIPLNCPQYIALDESDRVFVTDTTYGAFERNAVVKYSLDGAIKQAYNGWNLYAKGICCAGQAGVFICDTGKHSIRLLSSDLGSSKVVLDEKDGIKHPQTVCYCEQSGRLFVSSQNRQTFKVYSVKLH